MVQSGKSITKVMRKKFLQVVVVLLVISILGWNEETVFALENETAVTADESYSETEKELESVLKVEPESDLKENKVDETNFVNETVVDTDSRAEGESSQTDVGTSEMVQQSSYNEINLGMPTDMCVITDGNQILRISWNAGSYVGVEPSQVRYLVYRSDSAEGSFEKIGYTALGETFYVDGGGTSELEVGKTYFYKVQAYAPESGASSNLHNAEIAGGIVEAQETVEYEFSDTEMAAEYLRNQLIQRKDAIDIILWLPEYPKGYSKVLYQDAVEDREDLSISSSAGDYYQYHIKDAGYDCDFTDTRVQKNGLRKYILVYRPVYCTTSSQEQAVDAEVKRLVNGGLGIDVATASDVEKVRAVYEYLSENCVYDLSDNESGSERVTAYDALINHRAVCQGYANATYKLLRELGIVNRIVIGDVLWENSWQTHAWNIVKIDGCWYYVDATTEIHFYEEYGYIAYNWFLKTDREFDGKFRKDENIHNSLFNEAHPMGSAAIEVPLETTRLVAQAISSQTIKVTWEKTQRANGYELYRSVYKNKDYKLIKDIQGRETADKDIEKGIEYYYVVRPYYKNSNGEKIYGEYSDAYSAMCLETPVLKSTSLQLKTEGVYVQWNLSGDADYYEIYRSEDGEEYIKIESKCEVEQYMDRTVEADTEYYYKIKACSYIDSGKTESSFSNVRTIRTLEQLKINAVPSSGVTIKLNWETKKGFYAYDIYRSAQVDGEYKKIKTTTGVSTSDTNLVAGTRYYYKVAAYTKDGQYTMFSDPVAVVTLATSQITEISGSDDQIRVSWTKASGADRYNIYRSESAEGKYTYITSVLGGNITYVDQNLEKGKTYYYKIRAYKKIDGIVYYGGYSDPKGGTVDKAPDLFVTPKSGVTMRLQWDADNNFDFYEIYRSDSKDGDYQYIKATNQLSTSDTGLNAGQIYYYKIYAYKKINGVKTLTAKTESKAAVALATPNLNTVESSSKGIMLRWSKASGADRYNVYRATSANGTYEYVTSVLGGTTEYVDENIVSGINYYYKVRAYKRYDGVVYYGGYSNFLSGRQLPSTQLTIYPSSGVTIRLMWEMVNGADAYEIYRFDENKQDFTFLKATNQLSTSDTNLKAGTCYCYKIMPYEENDKGVKCYGKPVVAKTVALARPMISDSYRNENLIKISWTKASGADRYNIYRSDSVDGEYSYIASILGGTLEYTDENVKYDQSYYYKVRAYKRVDGIVYYGLYSDGIEVR